MSSSNKKYDIYSHNIVGSKHPSQRVKRAMSTHKLTPSHPLARTNFFKSMCNFYVILK